MSHIAKKPIQLPENVSVNIQLPNISISGPLGKSAITFPSGLHCSLVDNPVHQLVVSVVPIQSNADGKEVGVKSRELKKTYALWGTYRTLLNNMVTGVTRGFSIRLELNGVGYRGQVISHNVLNLKLGYSHNIDYLIPADVRITCVRPNLILISGIDRQRVNQVAAEIRRYRIPDAYKGKGVRYEGEIMVLKEGKKK